MLGVLIQLDNAWCYQLSLQIFILLDEGHADEDEDDDDR